MDSRYIYKLTEFNSLNSLIPLFEVVGRTRGEEDGGGGFDIFNYSLNRSLLRGEHYLLEFWRYCETAITHKYCPSVELSHDISRD